MEHFVSYGRTADDSIGVKLYSHCLRGEVIEVDLDFECVLVVERLDLHFAKVKGGPFLLQVILPIGHLFADFTFIDRT
jgi:hypothetical protein